MKTKAKKFSHKLLALFLAVLMAATCFTGVMTSYAASSDTKYADGDIEYNDLAWNILSDEQVATALLDYADSMLPALKELEPTIAKMVNNADIPVISVNYDLSKRQITAKFALTTLATITIKLGSVDELLETINSVQSVLDGGLINTASNLGIDLGFIKNLDLSAVNNMRRNSTSSTDIVRGVLGIIYDNNDAVIGSLLRGEFSTGVIGLDIYKTLGDLIGGIDAGYQSNFVYNFVQAVIFKYTEWFSDEEILAYKGGGTLTLADGSTKEVAAKTFVYDDALLEKMTTYLLDQINVLVTYSDGSSSASRRKEIDKKMESGMTYAEAAVSLGYDPNLIYSKENKGNILLFAYGNDKIALTKTDTLFSFGYQALKFAWETVLKDTVKLIHVNNDVERGHGTNFDNQYYYWASENIGWNTSDVASNYTMDKVIQWANSLTKIDLSYKDGQWIDKFGTAYTNTTDKTQEIDGVDKPLKDKDGRVIQQAEVQRFVAYGAADADEFIGWVKDNYRFDRTVAEDAVGNWRDIDATQLFNKLRYSPLADYVFDMQTGPINLYFVQTGTPNLDAFFETYLNDTYSSLVGGFNDALVAAVKDLFPNRDNIYVNAKGDTNLPALNTINPSGTIDSTVIANITNTLVGNALKVVQYVADTTDQNILNGFYKASGKGAALTEENFEDAMIPLLVSCIGEVKLTDYKLKEMIHPEDWDRCLDAEAVAFIALREYLSYVLPNKDYNTLATITDTKITADFNTCILPMARDAVIYVIEPYVPVTDKSGNQWKAEGDTIDTSTSFFDLLNSVVCYYADNYTFKNSKRSGEDALGVASLLGACDKNGKSSINMSNTLWENIDIIANKFFPVIGTLQGTGYGKVDSESLIMGDIVNGVLNIGDKNATTNMCGVSNFIYRLLTIFSAEPIQSTTIIRTAYDVVKDLLNGLFGPRYNGQEWVPVPDATSEHPWDDVLQKNVIAGPSSGNPGVLGKGINNLVEFSGFGYNGVATYPDSIIPGLMFALTAVNSFVNIVPSIGEHNLKMATAKLNDATFQGCSSGSTYSTKATLTNNSTGINVAYVDGMNDTVEQMTRYYIRVTGARINGSSTSATVTAPSSALLAPGESVSIDVNSIYSPASGTESSNYVVTFTYDICDASGNVIYSNLTAQAYQFLTGAKNWEDVVYPSDRHQDDGMYHLNMSLESDSAGATKEVNGYRTFTTSAFATKGRLIATVPEYVVLGSDNLSVIEHYGVRAHNTTNKYTGSSAGLDGLYYYDSKEVHDDATNTNVTVGADNPIPVFDKETGDIIKYGTFDISYDNGKNWNNNGGAGFTQTEVDAKLSEISNGDNKEAVNDFRTRDHVAVTFQDAKNNGIIAAYHFNEKSELYDYIYLQNGPENTIYRFDQLLGNISCRGPVDGFYINSGKQTVAKAGWAYFKFLQYDGKTAVSNTDVKANLAFYSGGGTGTATFTFRVCDTSNAASVQSRFEELQSLMAQYKTEDFIGGQTVYDTAHDALVSALSATALPLTPQTAVDLSDNTHLDFVTSTSDSKTGDKAYRPLTTAEYNKLTAGVKKLIYIDTVDGTDRYYLDAAHSRPVYSTVELTAADVTNGKDAYGMPVTAETKEGVTTYYYTNSVQYATEWDTTTYAPYPFKKSTGVQATNSSDKKLYDQVQWSYYNAKGDKVSSTSTWVVKVPDTSYQMYDINSTDESGKKLGDTRGIYTKNNDRLAYTIEYVKDSIDPAIGQSLLDTVSLVRNGLNETNFEIVTYNKMVGIAKTIESQYSLEVTYNKIEDMVDEYGNIIYGLDGKPVKVTNNYTETMGFADYAKLLADKKNVTIVGKPSVNSTLSSTQIAEYKSLFNTFLGAVVERGYLGDRLEEEIPCASGNTYSALSVDGITTNAEGGKDYSAATVSKTASATAPEFGAFNADGVLVNDGNVVYPEKLWSTYVEALARAVDLAQLGNGEYAHKDKANYIATANDYDARVTNVYDAKLDLQAAEIALENTSVLTINVPEGCTVTVNDEAYTKPMAVTTDSYVDIAATPAEGYTFTGFQVGEEVITDNPYSVKVQRDTEVSVLVESAGPTGSNVSGTIEVAKDATGETAGFCVAGEYTIELYSDADKTNLVATTTSAFADGANSFAFENLADGTYYATITSEYSIPRENVTIIVNGAEIADAVITVVPCDFDGNGVITADDAKFVFKTVSDSTNKDYCDFDNNGVITADDAKYVYKMSSGSTLPELVIQ